MAETEPTKLPEWASVPGIDPESLEPNISEPSESKKDSGFNFKERPPRQDFNWLLNLIWLWTKWFKQQTDGLLASLASFMGTTDVDADIITTPSNLTSGLDSKYLDYTIQGLDTTECIDNGSTQDIVFSPGKCLDKTGVFTINFFNADTTIPSGGFVKKWEASSFVRGSGESGYVGSTSQSALEVYVFAVHFSDDNSCDIMFDDNKAGTNALAVNDVDYVRRIGWFYSYSVNTINWYQNIGNHFYILRSTGATLGSISTPDSSEVFTTGLNNLWPSDIKGIIAIFEAGMNPSTTDTDFFGEFGSNSSLWDPSPTIESHHIARISGSDIKLSSCRIHAALIGDGTNSIKLKLNTSLTNGSIQITLIGLGWVDSRLPWNDL